MLERDIERYLKDQVIKAGGRCHKWVCPGQAGVPDRIVLLNKQIWFVEVKSPTGRLSRVQKEFMRELKEQGFNVIVIDNKQLVDGLISVITGMKS